MNLEVKQMCLKSTSSTLIW